MKLITFRHTGTVKAGVLADNDRIIVKDEGPDAAYAVRNLIESETGTTSWQGGVEIRLLFVVKSWTFWTLFECRQWRL